MKKSMVIAWCGAMFLVSGVYAGVGAQAPAPGGQVPPGAPAPPATAPAAGSARSANDGVYTAEQAKRGEAVYKEQCATCHGDNLEGSGPMPPLAGKDFLTNWTGKTVGDLFEKTSTTMPATAPGTLTPAQAADITAHMLSVGKYPAGATELEGKIEALTQITLDPPKE